MEKDPDVQYIAVKNTFIGAVAIVISKKINFLIFSHATTVFYKHGTVHPNHCFTVL
jgi:hypothetical protein